MSVEVKTPVLPESVADAAIATWHKQPGEHVTEGENLVDLETDKIVLEVPAPVSGALEEVLQEEGAVVVAGDVLAKIAPGQTPTLEISKDDVEKAIAEKETAPAAAPAAASNLPPHASPAVRQDLNAKGLSESDVTPSGPKSRILKEDVANIASSVMVPGEREEKRVPMTRLRARVAERLQQAQATAAILTTFNEVDMQPVMDLRAKYKDEFIKKHDVKLGFMSFFVKAACEALKKYPAVNASIDGNDIVYHGFYDVGVAVSTERGLVVPVLRSADQLSLAGIEENIIDFGKRAQAGKLGMDDLSGGTFTISNGGVFGSLMSTPIINPPQTGILGMHTIQKRPIAMGDQVVIRPMMYLALSYDHRLIDGKEAVQFLVTIKQLIEDPTRLLLDL